MIKDSDIIEFSKGETFSNVQLSHCLHKHRLHIVEIIDEGITFCPMVVYRYWLKNKKRWQYEIRSAYELTWYITPRKLNKEQNVQASVATEVK